MESAVYLSTHLKAQQKLVVNVTKRKQKKTKEKKSQTILFLTLFFFREDMEEECTAEANLSHVWYLQRSLHQTKRQSADSISFLKIKISKWAIIFGLP